ncbi:MAG: tetratricopeptide repeat protein, partial [Gemmatimonadota bacterium]|nr:tetratricopeptide repeat protein [Gemmatimonadota bacterium]
MLSSLIESAKEAHRSGAWDDALAQYSTALSLAPEDAHATADILRRMAAVYRERGDLDLAQEKLQQSRDVAHKAGDSELLAAALNGLAVLEMLRGNREPATALYVEARAIANSGGSDRMVAIVDQNLGILANIEGNVALALLSYRSALERYRRMGDEPNACTALNNMGMAHVDLGEWQAAESCFDEAQELAEQLGDAMRTGMVELNRSELHIKRRRYDAARESCDRALQVFQRLRSKQMIGEAYKFAGILHRETGKPDHADTYFALSLGLGETAQNPLLQAETQMAWALLHLEEERKQEGILRLNRALGIFRNLQARREVLDIERRLDRLKELYLPAVEAWGAKSTEAKDPFQTGHALRVAEYSTRLAREIGMEGWSLTWLRLGALLHDVGNVALPEEVLQKSDALSPEEREMVQVHTVMGDSLVAQLDFPAEVRPVVRSHHEHWAGTGYPDGLKGEQIPLGARIVSIAEVYDALTSPRSFRVAYTPERALQVMEQECTGMFDPALFTTFREMLLAGGTNVAEGIT